MPLIMYVVYDHPSDCPTHWVVRRWAIETDVSGVVAPRPAAVGIAYDTLDAARAAMPHGSFNLGNEMETDPCIAEVWI